MILSTGGALALAAGLVALLGYGIASFVAQPRVATAAFFAGWVAHAATLVVDIAGIGQPGGGARFGFAPVLSLTVWLVLAVHAVESRFVPLAGVRRALALGGMAAVALVLFFPGQARVHAGSPWMPLHWILGIASYGLFGAAVLHASLLDAAERQLRQKSAAAPGGGPLGLPLLRLERLTFRFVEAGFLMLSAALVLGVGTTVQWRWDHKTVFSLLGWLTFAGLIAGRHLSGWRGRRATRWLYVGAALLLLAYIGSRFVLEVVLHRGAA